MWDNSNCNFLTIQHYHTSNYKFNKANYMNNDLELVNPSGYILPMYQSYISTSVICQGNIRN